MGRMSGDPSPSRCYSNEEDPNSPVSPVSLYSLRTRRFETPRATAIMALAAVAVSSAPVMVNSLAPCTPISASRKHKRRPISVTPDSDAYTTESTSTPKKKRLASPKSKKLKFQDAPRTESFSALWSGSVLRDEELQRVSPHTLILGTHPSIKSLERQQYYGHQMNAFWWIAGDCLGFRRDSGISVSTGTPYKFTSSLRYEEDRILSYDEQEREMVKHGFAMWDVVASCQRPGSLDQDIFAEEPNRIREFCDQIGTIQRIVLANGGTGSKMFAKHFGNWLGSGELVAGADKASQTAFAKKIETAKKKRLKEDNDMADVGPDSSSSGPITLISALSVSPAAARYSYEQKRYFWEEYVYKPGLNDLQTSTLEDR